MEETLSWCDKLAATPTVGFRFDWHFVGGDVLLQSLSPILDPLGQGEKQRFTMQQQDSFGFAFITQDGYQYGINASRAHVSFQHRLKAKPVSGGLPVMEMLSQPRPYTKLLPDVCERLIDATVLLPHSKGRKLNRLGIVTSARVSVSDSPPGISRFISYVGRPWKQIPAFYNFQITSDLEKGPNYVDRCVHTVTKSEEDEDALVTLNFDWQRTFTNGRPLNRDILEKEVQEGKKAALKYFEDIAEGSRFDEDIISATT